MLTECDEAQVRPGVEGGLEAPTDIYNHYVRETPVTFDTATFIRSSPRKSDILGCSPTLKTARTG
jgi:hypothetical protein